MTVCGTGTGNFPQPGDPDLNSPVLSAQAVFGGILVSWTFPELNSHAVAHTRLYRSTNADPESRILHRRPDGDSHFDSFEGEIGNTYYYWIQVISVNGTVGDLLGPASATVEPTIKQMLQKLSGEISNSLLDQDLTSKIERINGLSSDLLGEINARTFNDDLLGEALQQTAADLANVDTLVQSEITERVTGQEALVQEIDLILVKTNDNLAAINAESLARTTENEAMTEQINTAISVANENTGKIESEATTRSTENAAMTEQIDLAISATEENSGAIATETQTRSDQYGAMTEQLDTAISATESNSGAIQQEAITRANEDEALASLITRLQASDATIHRTEGEPTEAVEEEDIWIDLSDDYKVYQRQNGVWVESTPQNLAGVFASLEVEQLTRTDGINALAVKNSNLEALVGTKARTYFQASSPSNTSELKPGDLWIKTDEENKLHRYNGTAWVDARDAGVEEGMKRATIFRQSGTPTALNTGDIWFDSSKDDKAHRWDGNNWVPMSLYTGTQVTASIQDNNITMVGYCEIGGQPDSSHQTPEECTAAGGEWKAASPLAEAVKTVEIDDGGGGVASVQQHMSSYRDELNGLNAQWGVKLNAGELKGGIGLYLAEDPDDETKDVAHFAVRADLLSLGRANDAQVFPFIIKDDVVYLNSAVMEDAMITNAMISSLSALKITGLTATFIEARIQNLHVNKISGDVNETIPAGKEYNLNLSNNNSGIYREGSTLTIPSNFRARIPLLFTKARHSLNYTGSSTIRYRVVGLRPTIPGSTSLETPNSRSYMTIQWDIVRSSGDGPPSNWDDIISGTEIRFSVNSVWHYGQVSHKSTGSSPAGPYDAIDHYYVHFSVIYARGNPSTSLGGSYALRNGSDRVFQEVISESQQIINLDAGESTEVNAYVLSLPRTTEQQTYHIYISGDGTINEIDFTALVVR